MPGRFEGLSDLEWMLFEDLFPVAEKRGRGMSPTPPRKVINSLLYLLITGSRWADLPKDNQWASKSSGHRWLQRWFQDGTFGALKAIILGIAQKKGMINWNYGAVDGSFSSGKGGGQDVKYGYKGKGILIHLIVDGEGMPLSAHTTAANGDERKQVEPLLEKIDVRTRKPGRPPKHPKKLAGDKGYDSKCLRKKLKARGIQPQIPKRKNAKRRLGRPPKMDVPRFKVERAFSWLQRKFRRLVVRWERLSCCFDAFLSLGIIFMWTQRLVG